MPKVATSMSLLGYFVCRKLTTYHTHPKRVILIERWNRNQCLAPSSSRFTHDKWVCYSLPKWVTGAQIRFWDIPLLEIEAGSWIPQWVSTLIEVSCHQTHHSLEKTCGLHYFITNYLIKKNNTQRYQNFRNYHSNVLNTSLKKYNNIMYVVNTNFCNTMYLIKKNLTYERK